MLIHWSTLEPSGPSKLAAIRFSSPVCIHSLSIFPTGAHPFANSPDTVARTEPDAFFLKVYFNAVPISAAAKQKAKANNALLPTTLAYTGTATKYAVNMNQDYATRLMIVQGDFACVSIGIYGDVGSELPPPPSTYDVHPLPSNEPSPLTPALDPSNTTDPTLLPRQLLAHLPDIPLELVIRLMFCLKPPKDDWDLPDFPHLYADLGDPAAKRLDEALWITSRPMASDVLDEQIGQFADMVAEAADTKDKDQAYVIAGILRNSASQGALVKKLCEKLDLENIFEASQLDEATITRLLDATASPVLAYHLNTSWFHSVLDAVESITLGETRRKAAIKRLRARMYNWQILEDALSNTQADFTKAAQMLRDLGTEEQSFGVWLTSIVSHEDLIIRLRENPAFSLQQVNPQSRVVWNATGASHEEFIAFLRAYTGVASVLAVFAWADSLPDEQCREKTLAIIRLWQQVDGYREIVNHLLLLPQITFRLECMIIDNDPPTRACMTAEGMLLSLADDPTSFLSGDVQHCILSCDSLSLVSLNEQLSHLRDLALLVEHGVSGAAKELARLPAGALDTKAIARLRVALAMLVKEMSECDDGDWRMLESLWQSGTHSLVSILTDNFTAVSEHVHTLLSLSVPERLHLDTIGPCFLACSQILELVTQLLPNFPMPTRAIRNMACHVADTFASTDTADMLYTQTSPACIAAQAARQTCIDFMRTLADPTMNLASVPQSSGGYYETVLSALLKHGVRVEGHDPAHHTLQVFSLIDYLLPSDDADDKERVAYTRAILPNMLSDLTSFFDVLDTENKLHLVKRLVALDEGTIGVGEWLLIHELNHLWTLLQALSRNGLAGSRRSLKQTEVSLALDFLCDITGPSSSVAAWGLSTLETVPEAADTLGDCLIALIEQHLRSPHAGILARRLAEGSEPQSTKLRAALAITLVHAVEDETSGSWLELAGPYVISCNENPDVITILKRELGIAFSDLGRSAVSDMSVEVAGTAMDILRWLSQADAPSILSVQSVEAHNALLQVLKAALSAEQHAELLDILKRIGIEEETDIVPSIDLPSTVDISLVELNAVLGEEQVLPSTPPQKPMTHVDGAFGMTVSPPTSLLRSPTVSRTKTYLGDGFRAGRISQLQNTSRLPSMHVDEFELSAGSPPLAAAPGTMPVSSFPGDPFTMLAPAFNAR